MIISEIVDQYIRPRMSQGSASDSNHEVAWLLKINPLQVMGGTTVEPAPGVPHRE